MKSLFFSIVVILSIHAQAVTPIHLTGEESEILYAVLNGPTDQAKNSLETGAIECFSAANFGKTYTECEFTDLKIKYKNNNAAKYLMSLFKKYDLTKLQSTNWVATVNTIMCFQGIAFDVKGQRYIKVACDIHVEKTIPNPSGFSVGNH